MWEITEICDPGADPGFLDRGFKFTKEGGGGSIFLILPDYLSFFPEN